MSNFFTNKLNTLDRMFYGCGNLSLLDISNLYTSSKININNIFQGVISNITVRVNKDINEVLKK